MCLSSVYKITGDSSELVCKNVQNVMLETPGELRFRDIMGIEYKIKGRILSIDLVNNTIDVEEIQA